MTQTTVINAYFEWMYNIVCGDRFPNGVSYRRLLMHLHDTEFIYSIPRDANRAEDGVNLRYRFAYETGYPEAYLEGPCSVLEMVIALAIRIEETIMDDPVVGNRTGQWVWGMLNNLGLGFMDDARYDGNYVEDVLLRLLHRHYSPNGSGGLFTIKHCRDDLRDVEIWYQACWYLDTIV